MNFKSTCISLALATPFLAAQGLSPDEVKVTSRPYAAPAQNIFRVDTKLVDIGVVVRDNHGRAVPGLTKESFQILDNGKEREIANFAVDSTGVDAATPPSKAGPSEAPESPPAPTPKPAAVRQRFIALYFDDVNAKDGQHMNDLKQTQDAAQKFVKEALQPGVQMGVFTASGAETLDFTTDRAKLIETIGALRAHVVLSETGCPTPYLAYLVAVRHDQAAIDEISATRNLDPTAFVSQCQSGAVSQAEGVWQRARQLSSETLDSIGQVADHLATMPGTRLLLLASSGFITVTLEQQRDRIINNALQAGVVINALDSKGLYEWLESRTKDVALTQRGGQGTVIAGLAHNRFETVQMGLRVETMNEPLAALAEGTGGVFFHNSNDLDAGFRELGVSPEVVYRLGFRLPDGAVDGGYHRLKVKLVRARSESVQARPGYFEPARKAATEPENVVSKFDQEVTSADTIEDFPVNVSAENAKFPGGEKAVSIVAKINISKLNFTKQGDRRKQTIRFVSAFTDAQGSIVAAKEATMELSLKEATYTRLLKSGLNAKLTLSVAPGTYTLREVVETTPDQKFACSTHPIEVQ